MLKSKRVSLCGDFFQAKGDERPIVIVTAGLWREKQMFVSHR
jgi:hypothetical protein